MTGHIHVGKGSGGLGQMKGRDGAAYVCLSARAVPQVLHMPMNKKLRSLLSLAVTLK